jgi:hypothetical protein
MAGGLMQLVAYGSQDVYLTGNPQITFFKVVYRRHTNFSVEAIEQTFNGTPDFGKKVSCTISRNGDLIYRMYLEATLPSVDVSNTMTSDASNAHWVNYVGERLIDYVEVEIGGQRIDKHYGEWLHIWNQLTLPSGQEVGYQRMVGNMPELTGNNLNPSIKSGLGTTGIIPQTKLYIPLQFWFCRNPGLALPLIALQYHEVKINIQFNALKYLFYALVRAPNTSDIAGTTNIYVPNSNGTDIGSLVSASLWVDYVFLDTDERRRFAQLSHEYLIEQLQYPGEETITSATSTKIKLNFNHPVKEIIWVTQKALCQNYLQWCNYTDRLDATPTFTFDPLGSNLIFGLAECFPNAFGVFSGIDISNSNYVLDKGYNTTANAKIQLNGQDRFAVREGDYFNYVQPYQHHTRTPQVGINVYSFALRPEEHQPSGSCNFSRIDNANLLLTLTANTLNFGTLVFPGRGIVIEDTPNTSNSANAYCRIYAVNYNVLRIMSGMGGLAYSN